MRFTPHHAGREPVARRAPAGRDRPRHGGQRAHHGHGRADDVAVHARDRASVRGDRGAEGATASPSSTSATAWKRSTSWPTALSVLRDGGYVGTLDRAELSAPKLVSMMVGPRPVDLLQEGTWRLPAATRDRALGRRGWATAGACTTAPSTSAAARCWALPALSARAAPNWRG